MLPMPYFREVAFSLAGSSRSLCPWLKDRRTDHRGTNLQKRVAPVPPPPIEGRRDRLHMSFLTRRTQLDIIDGILASAAHHGVPVSLHVHLNGGGSPLSPASTRASRSAHSQGRTQAVLDALAGKAPVKKEAIIRSVFGTGFTSSQGRAITRILSNLAKEGRVTQPEYGMWQLA